MSKLIYVGTNEDGETEFIGTRKDWEETTEEEMKQIREESDDAEFRRIWSLEPKE